MTDIVNKARMGMTNRITGLLVSLVLIISGCYLVFFNEGRVIKTMLAVQKSASQVIAIDASSVNPGAHNKLVHISGMATTPDTLADEEFGVKVNAIHLVRNAEMYQWVEMVNGRENDKNKEQPDSPEDYRYQKQWKSLLVNSSAFKVPENHKNPDMFPYSSAWKTADIVYIGAFRLGREVINLIGEPVPIPAALPEGMPSARIVNGYIYIGDGSTSQPEIGDVRISFAMVAPKEISVIGRQAGDEIRTYNVSRGSNILMLQHGKLSALEMYAATYRQHLAIKWLMRAIAMVLIVLGFHVILKPLQVMLGEVTFLNRVIARKRYGASIMPGLSVTSFLFATTWLYYQPRAGLGLIALAIITMTFFIYAGLRRLKA